MFKKTYFKNLKKKIIGSFVALGMFTSAFAGICFAPSSQAYAYDNECSSTYFSDPNFTSYSGSSPLKPSKWSLIEGEGNYNSNTMIGAIFNSKDSNTESYLKKYKVFAYPGVPTSNTDSLSSNDSMYYSLALSAPYKSGGNFGYKPDSSKLSLENDSFYSIDITFRTEIMTDTSETALYKSNSTETSDSEEGTTATSSVYSDSIDTMASIYLTGFEEGTENTKFEMVQSQFGQKNYGDWGTYSFYIATNQLSGCDDLDLELWLGSKTQVSSGAVFFNSIKVREMDYNIFNNLVETAKDKEYINVIDLRSTIDDEPIENANFTKSWTNGWKVVSYDPNTSDVQDVNIKTFTDSAYYKKHNLSVDDNPAKTNFRTPSDTSKVLFMANSEDAYTAIESTSEFTFEKQSYYKVSVWAWSNSSAKAYAILTNTTEDITLDDASIEISTSSSTSDGKTNGWTEYSFYVYGDKFVDATAKLRLALGSCDEEGTVTGTTGYVFFDNITVQRLNYSEFSDNSSNSNCTTFNYNAQDDDFTISNYSFNITENEDSATSYPLKPTSWTYSESTTGENVTVSGVVNTHESLFDSNELAVEYASKPSNPGVLPYAESDAYNNVLMMGSKFKSEQSYTSSTFTLNADSYYKLSVYVNATNGGAGIKVSNSNGVIYNKTNIKSQGWTQFVAYVRTGVSEESVTFTLSLTNNENTTEVGDFNTKYAFFDEVMVEESSESVYGAVVASSTSLSNYTDEHISKINLLNYDFDNNTSIADCGFEVTESSDGKYAKVEKLSSGYGLSAHSGENALVVNANDTNGTQYFTTSKRTYTLSSGSYYKLSVYVMTRNIANGGATIKITGTDLDEAFYDINTETTNSNKWTEYTFFINASSDSTATLSLGLGNDETKSSGTAFFDDITFEKLADEDEYNLCVETLGSTQKAVVVEASADDDTTTDDETTDDDEQFEGSFNWYIVTSLVTAIAIIIAVVGVMLRKINFKQHKKVKTQYDRRRTLDVSLDKKERIARRQEEIKELERQLKEIEDEIAGIRRDVEVEKEEFTAQHNEAKAIIEQRKQVITDEKEKALHERNEKLAQDKNAFTREEEEKFASYIKKLEKQEQKELHEMQKHDKAISNFKTSHALRLQKTIARQEFIKAEIARIDAEIEAIAKEEAQIWEDYRLAKADAKRRKAEYKAEQKAKKMQSKSATKEVIDNDSKSEEPQENKDETEEVEVIAPDEDNK